VGASKVCVGESRHPQRGSLKVDGSKASPLCSYGSLFLSFGYNSRTVLQGQFINVEATADSCPRKPTKWFVR
jgi:hypothetical protein